MLGAVSCYAAGDDFASLADVLAEFLHVFVVYMLLLLYAVIAEFRPAS